MTPIVAPDTAAPTASPTDPTRAPADDQAEMPSPELPFWRRLSTAVAESHRAAVPF